MQPAPPTFPMKRAMFAAGLLALTSATAPHHLAFQVVDQRGLPLQGAVVEIARPAGDTRPVSFAPHYGMAQRNIAFLPGTLLVPAGTTVAFPNLDTVRHSIYSFSKAGRFQIDLYGRDQTRSHEFTMPGSIALGCHIHDKMRGYIRVTTTPYQRCERPCRYRQPARRRVPCHSLAPTGSRRRRRMARHADRCRKSSEPYHDCDPLICPSPT